MIEDYPEWLCGPCGLAYGRRPAGDGASWHRGTCGICGAKAAVTEPRDFGHLRPEWQQVGQGVSRGRKAQG